MAVYLVQHGVARSKEEDPDRPLTEAGREEVERVARAVAAAGARPSAILHSGKTRARETAEILGARLEPPDGVHAEGQLGPDDDPGAIGPRLEEAEASVMVVGHLPHLSRLAALLVAGRPEPAVVAFRNAGVVCLERADGRLAVRWILVPELVHG